LPDAAPVVLGPAVVVTAWLPAREARAMAWLKVFGAGFVAGAAVRAAWASEAEEAVLRSFTLSETVRERSVKDSWMLGG